MSWDYCCPKCKTMLNPDRSVILSMARDETQVLVGLHPQPGKYEVYLPPNVFTEDGTRWDFSCPMCKTALATADDENLCELELRIDAQPVKILFSCIAGEHATFILHESTVREQYGEDVSRYTPATKEGKPGRERSALG